MVKAVVLTLAVTLAFNAYTSNAIAKESSKKQVSKSMAPETPEQELQALKDGNMRFVAGNLRNHDYRHQIDKTKDGQKPYAVILSCLDSRIPVEVVFDQGIGELFVARVAGNIENNDILGSMEFGTAAMGAKLVVVMGHTKCGAIKGACNNVKLGHLTALLDKIQPAVRQVKNSTTGFNPESYDHVDLVSEENVKQTVARIRKNSEIIRKLEEQGKVRIVGAMYDISTGNVKFMDAASKLADIY
ncbi:carbonic anhydrase family protein [Bdellovibrio sp. HCB288]|uniref:carbonic anhydrase family protein n=1 Tax=Bdellovibrio sp. HCB288 TaxID=3394355 RepID=UPI0039B6504E